MSKVLHLNCNSLPLYNFKQCFCYGNLKALRINTTLEVPEVILQNAWIDIFYQFIELTKDADMRSILRIERKLNLLRNKKLEVELMVNYLVLQWKEEYVDTLRGFGYRYKFDPLRPIEYSRDLKLILSRSERFSVEIEMLEIQLETYEAASKGNQPNESYFTHDLIMISKWLKFHINDRQITVSEFCEYKNQYNSENKPVVKKGKNGN